MIATSRKKDWDALAAYFAKDAHENYFQSRRGVWPMEDAEVLCVYNNNPYAKDPKARGREVTTFRNWLKSQGIKELAISYYGDADDPNYTFAMLIDAGKDRLDDVVQEWQGIVEATMSELK